MCATCDAAWRRFQAWLARQSDAVQNQPICDQIALYAKRETD